MAGHQVDTTWMWHPLFEEHRTDTAGLFVHFKRDVVIEDEPPASFKVHITADTRYKLYVNAQLAAFGPVKGDQHLWFFDEVDVGPFLKRGANKVAVHVLRFFHSTLYATAFPRLPSGGLRMVALEPDSGLGRQLQSSTTWLTAIDPSTMLRVDEPEDDFLHIYERRVWGGEAARLHWVHAKVLEYQTSTGNSTPWVLSPRQIPPLRRQKSRFSGLHNIQSSAEHEAWKRVFFIAGGESVDGFGDRPQEHHHLRLPAGSHHKVDLKAPHHMTGFLRIRFRRPQTGGTVVTLLYAESYEDKPTLVPYLRNKEKRTDSSKSLFGPTDSYVLAGADHVERLGYHEQDDVDEVLLPFHFRTFRFIQLDIRVGDSDLVLKEFEIETVNYPLDVHAALLVPAEHDKLSEQLWTTSLQTLLNCMHDCYEDCPFYEQLQYAMDARSSCLFTYCVSGDDRLARQAIIQLHNSFQPRLGLTCSRAPSHRAQVIPHFSLFWICMLSDHFVRYGDERFLAPFVPVVDAILGYFHAHLDATYDIVASDLGPGLWNFVDWTPEWRPYGIPPSASKTGISTYSNHLYAYALKQGATLLRALGRAHLADEYAVRADRIVAALRRHCFDGQFFTDSLASGADPDIDYSEHAQVWAVLSGAVEGEAAQVLLRRCLAGHPEADKEVQSPTFIKTSISMSFYTLRALSIAGGDLYDTLFHTFWGPWRTQLDNGLTTWEEDTVSQRSDCHAWGSAPLYEFMAEVAGVRPAEPGWAAVAFQPRLALYAEFHATVPMKMIDGVLTGMVRVSWATDVTSRKKTVRLRIEMKNDTPPPVVHVLLSSFATQYIPETGEMVFVV
ncbi:hypothetical protein Sste5346_004593 [Sporothrix stenoceras]|uniref:Alpha-L-rhamnosidase six-hairpin glycosidase domain-containing protein n=1 Tax=Sporothrix stenoceras TaxID=5173 RepID=A0ABR3Z7G7_9PEZI